MSWRSRMAKWRQRVQAERRRFGLQVGLRLDEMTDAEVIDAVKSIPPHYLIAEVGSGSQRAGTQRTGNSSAALTLNFPAATTSGNLLILVLAADGTNADPTVKDSNNNTWSKAVGSASNGNSGWTQIWYLANAPSCTSVTVTPANAVFLSVAIDEFSGAATSTPVDQTNSGIGSSNTPSSGNVVTATDGELYVGAMDEDASAVGSITTENGWTNVYTNPATSVLEGISFQFIIANHGTLAATWTFGGTVSWSAAIASFKPAAGGAATLYRLTLLGVG